MDYDSCSVIQPAIMAAGWIGLHWRMGALPPTAIPPPTGWQNVASRLAASVSAVLIFCLQNGNAASPPAGVIKLLVNFFLEKIALSAQDAPPARREAFKKILILPVCCVNVQAYESAY
ncbi:MAG: hypothetical protein HFH28_05860 [Clostridiaceae bacterium]|nr:hypothetical protein [Clostridiaceae bacterium]